MLSNEFHQAPRLPPISEAATAYRLVHRRIAALVCGRADIAELSVPACPAWSVRTTVAHLAGVAQDIVALNLERKGTDGWARAQVDRLGTCGVDELLDLWEQLLDPVAEVLALSTATGVCQLVFDTLTHEHDIRGAVTEPGSRTDDPAFGPALSFMTTIGDRLIRHATLPALQLTTPTIGAVQLGDPSNERRQVAVDISDFEALRAFGGRRSVRQLWALPWQGDPTELLPAFTHHLPAFTNEGIRPPLDDLIE